VEHILIIYNEIFTDINEIHNMFNSISPDSNLTLKQEQNNGLNFVDLTIEQTTNKLVFDIYRKPTASGNFVPNDSCHPSEPKPSAILYFTNSLNTYDMDCAKKNLEKRRSQVSTYNGPHTHSARYQ